MKAIVVLDDPVEMAMADGGGGGGSGGGHMSDQGLLDFMKRLDFMERLSILPPQYYEALEQAEEEGLIPEEEASEQPEPVQQPEPVPIKEIEALKVPPVPVNQTYAEGMMNPEKINEIVYEAFSSLTKDMMKVQNEFNLATATIPWALETVENITKMTKGFPDLSFLYSYYEGSRKYLSQQGVEVYCEKGVNYYLKDINEIKLQRESMGKLLSEIRENPTEDNVWKLYNMIESDIIFENAVIAGLERIPSNGFLQGLILNATSIPDDAPEGLKEVASLIGGTLNQTGMGQDWVQRAKDLINQSEKDASNLKKDVAALEKIRDGLLEEIYPMGEEQ